MNKEELRKARESNMLHNDIASLAGILRQHFFPEDGVQDADVLKRRLNEIIGRNRRAM